MSHAEQLAFFELLAVKNPALVAGGSVLEIGSYDVNGSVRQFFGAAEQFVGVDLSEGPGVDAVSFGHEFTTDGTLFDLVISGECFEHDPHWRETFANMVRLTRPGGITAFTCASRGRPEHGTRRTDASESPGSQHVGLDYYRNLVEDDFSGMPLHTWFEQHRFWRNESHFDLFFAGVRAGDDESLQAFLPDDADVAGIEKLMSFPHRSVRFPLRLASQMLRDEDRFQSFAVPYWKLARQGLGESGWARKTTRVVRQQVGSVVGVRRNQRPERP